MGMAACEREKNREASRHLHHASPSAAPTRLIPPRSPPAAAAATTHEPKSISRARAGARALPPSGREPPPRPPRARAMASDARLSLPCRLPARLPPPPPPALRRSPRASPAAAASTSPRCRVSISAVPARPRGRWRARAAGGEAQGQVQQQQQREENEEVVDSNVLPYCSIDRKQKKTIGEMEQEFLQARPQPASTPSFFFLFTYTRW